MKGILGYIWKNRLLPKSGLYTACGDGVEIISYGREEGDSGIFAGAKVRIGSETWCGNVVLHQDGTGNGKAAGLENIILHVTTKEQPATPMAIPHLRIALPHGLEAEFAQAEKQQHCLPCDSVIPGIRRIDISSFLSRLAVERIEEKAESIMHTLAECSGLWDDALFKTVARSFGFGIQSAVFEKWARVLDMNALGKHRDSLLQVEAIMFGQAGLLDEESIPHYYLKEALESGYYKEISREYRFLKNKFGLQGISFKEWNCGNVTPHVRIARLAALYCTKRISISGILACSTLSEYYSIFDTVPGGYWRNRTCFGGTETMGSSGMRPRQLDVIIINAVVPTLYTYGKHRNDSAVCSKAEDLLQQIKGEENSIVKKWKERGIAVECAADSQALIQLERKYCRAAGCTGCRIACHYIKERLGCAPE